MATSIQCGQYGCKGTLEREEDIYCKSCGGRKRAVKEGLVPKMKRRTFSSRRGGAVGQGLSKGNAKRSDEELKRKRESDAEAKARREDRRTKLHEAQPTGRREGSKGQSGCEGRGDSKKSKRIRSKREKKRGIRKGKQRANKAHKNK